MKRSVIAEYLDIDRQRISAMITTKNNGGRFGDDIGRPHILDHVSYSELPSKVEKVMVMTHNPLKESQFYDLVQECAVQSDIHRGGNGIGVAIKDNRTIEQIKKVEE